MANQCTRLAPSPTGALHLGNARTFLVNWLLARRHGWRIILRIEDLDGPRIKSGSAQQAMDDLNWLGLDWDEGPVSQSSRHGRYQEAIDRLINQGNAYACACSRREVELAASAPHAEDGAAIYPGTCRGRFATLDEARRQSGRPPAIRFAVPDRTLIVKDRFLGDVRFNPAHQLGDFVIAKNDGSAAYQLAVVVDDADMNITQVVRGDDLLDSTPRQMLIYEALGLSDRIPAYTHLPLVVGTDGRRLAKRHGDTRLSTYRQRGVPAAKVVQLLAGWCCIEATSTLRRPADCISRFSLDALPRRPIVYDAADDPLLKD
ncbi:MAG: tRNA glutamyl-Q(34) synthetase GluQRS [Phycisphaerales bacterium]|nr:tRNA glutamyl-Q(34) synthetase GluQRS [Phycisphaerales bacterium]